MAEPRELQMGELNLTRRVWRKSTASNADGTGCLELAVAADALLVRDSKDRAGPILVFSSSAWNALRVQVIDRLLDTR